MSESALTLPVEYVEEDKSTVSIILPTLGRPKGLQRCLESIERLTYSKELIDTLVIHDDPRLGVPKRVAEGVEKTDGDYIIYAANDMEFSPDSISRAIAYSKEHNKALVSFNTGPILPDEGNICEHFVIRRDFLPEIGGEIFDTDFHHVGVDNLLWAKASKLGQASRCADAFITHYHFSVTGDFDEIYGIAWSNVGADRDMLSKKLKEI